MSKSSPVGLLHPVDRPFVPRIYYREELLFFLRCYRDVVDSPLDSHGFSFKAAHETEVRRLLERLGGLASAW